MLKRFFTFRRRGDAKESSERNETQDRIPVPEATPAARGVYRSSSRHRRDPGEPTYQMSSVGDVATVPMPAPPLPQPHPETQTGHAPIMVTTRPPNPDAAFYDEFLRLLRESRRAQSALIDQQRETLRYLRSLDKWLNESSREQDEDIRRILTSIETLGVGLHEEVGRLFDAGVPGVQGGQQRGMSSRPRTRRARRRG